LVKQVIHQQKEGLIVWPSMGLMAIEEISTNENRVHVDVA